MEQKLSRYQNLLVLIIALLLHAGILLSIIIMKFDHPQTEAMVVLAQNDEPQQYQTPQNDWVTMAQATQASPTAAQQAMHPGSAYPGHQTRQATPGKTPSSNVPEESTPTLNEEQMQNAVSLAQKLLARAEKRESNKPDTSPKESSFAKPPTLEELRRPGATAVPCEASSEAWMDKSYFCIFLHTTHRQ